MAKFIQSVGETKKASDFTAENLVGFKNPYQSQNPFKDGQTLEFEGFVPVSWKHEDYGEGKYIAIKFKGIKSPLALTSLTKEITAYRDKELKNVSDFANEGGLAEVVAKHNGDGGVTPELLKDIETYFKKEDTAYKAKLTYYYDRKFNNVKKCSLTNVVSETKTK